MNNEVWLVNRYDHEAIPLTDPPRDKPGFEKFIPKTEYDALANVFMELLNHHCGVLKQDRTGYRYDIMLSEMDRAAVAFAVASGWINEKDVVR